eukprot:SAG31_NODE_499_length_14841_cov_7.930471_18_plen_44_part_00
MLSSITKLVLYNNVLESINLKFIIFLLVPITAVNLHAVEDPTC